MTSLEGTLSTELFSKNVEFDLLSAGIFIFFLSSLVYSGEGTYIVWYPVHI